VNADEQAIRNLVAQWHHTTAAGDVEAVLRLMAEDVVFLIAGQPPMKGRSTFEKGLRRLLASHDVQPTGEVQEVETSGDLAYCWAVLNVRIEVGWHACCSLRQRLVDSSQARTVGGS